MIYRNYLCSDDEREKFDKTLFQNEEEYQKKLREKYNVDHIFDNHLESMKKNKQTIDLIEYKEPKWYHKIFEKILSLFKK